MTHYESLRDRNAKQKPLHLTGGVLLIEQRAAPRIVQNCAATPQRAK